jgi:hypothetical protein
MICQAHSGDLHERMHLRVTRQNDFEASRFAAQSQRQAARRTSGGVGDQAFGIRQEMQHSRFSQAVLSAGWNATLYFQSMERSNYINANGVNHGSKSPLSL